MNIENVILNENLRLKPLPQTILYCSVCKTDSISHLKWMQNFINPVMIAGISKTIRQET